MSKKDATITNLTTATQYNGLPCTLVSWSLDKDSVRVTVRVAGKCLLVKLQNLILSTKCSEANMISAIAKQISPVITIDTGSADPTQFFTQLGLAVLTGSADTSGFTFQSFMNCTHVLALARGKHVAEPMWYKVKIELELKSAEILCLHNLRRLAYEYAEHVLRSDPTNVKAIFIMKQ